MSDLKPCPFCGSVDLDTYEYSETLLSAVHCKNCEALGPGDDSDTWEARTDLMRAAWNRRNVLEYPVAIYGDGDDLVLRVIGGNLRANTR
jgi:Lar family restriction alleviation protein